MDKMTFLKVALALVGAGLVAAIGLAIAGIGSGIYWLVAAGFAVFGYSIHLRLRRIEAA
jgi:hypothetical protein